MKFIKALRAFSKVTVVKMRTYTYEYSNSNLWPQSGKMAQRLDGKGLSEKINTELKQEIRQWIEDGHKQPHLTCVLVGNDPASSTYVGNKIKAASFVGISSETLRLNSSITEEELLKRIDALNRDKSVDGILVQLPLPSHISERNICNAISIEKDVDGFHVSNVGQLCLDMPTIVPCTPLGVAEIIKRYNIPTHGRSAVVVGRSKNVSLPMAMLLHADKSHESGLGMDSTVTICHRYTPREQLVFQCRNADIIVTATGIPKLITADMVKPGATIIDVGLTRVTDENGKTKLVGDVDFEEVSKIAGYITPVPGGVGPMTVAMLMRNTLQAARALATMSHES